MAMLCILFGAVACFYWQNWYVGDEAYMKLALERNGPDARSHAGTLLKLERIRNKRDLPMLMSGLLAYVLVLALIGSS